MRYNTDQQYTVVIRMTYTIISKRSVYMYNLAFPFDLWPLFF